MCHVLGENILFEISNAKKIWKFLNKSTGFQHTSKSPLSSFLDFWFLMCVNIDIFFIFCFCDESHLFYISNFSLGNNISY